MRHPAVKSIIFLLCLLPATWLFTNFFLDNLGANPFEALTRQSGEWTLRFLLVVLAITPLRKLTRQSWLMAYRRMLGLYVFFYACLHLMTYLWFDQFFDWNEILIDILKRPFITVGMLAFVLLVPLAITSTNNWMRRLGKRWKQLHQTVYIIGILAVLHYLWLVKADLREPLIYAGILLLLLGYRVNYKMLLRRIKQIPQFRLN
ncbi:MAG: protein-methionine-sulfoxide reductase heme-binding subunit MsrQ [Thioalkalispiraceae bacterium]|jgi:sulfoxide reductase heme-binding subunit YedZ